jgi:hypothetical protein
MRSVDLETHVQSVIIGAFSNLFFLQREKKFFFFFQMQRVCRACACSLTGTIAADRSTLKFRADSRATCAPSSCFFEFFFFFDFVSRGALMRAMRLTYFDKGTGPLRIHSGKNCPTPIRGSSVLNVASKKKKKKKRFFVVNDTRRGNVAQTKNGVKSYPRPRIEERSISQARAQASAAMSFFAMSNGIEQRRSNTKPNAKPTHTLVLNDATTYLWSMMSQRTDSFSNGVFCSVTAMSCPGHESMFGAITMPKLRAVMRLTARCA